MVPLRYLPAQRQGASGANILSPYNKSEPLSDPFLPRAEVVQNPIALYKGNLEMLAELQQPAEPQQPVEQQPQPAEPKQPGDISDVVLQLRGGDSDGDGDVAAAAAAVHLDADDNFNLHLPTSFS